MFLNILKISALNILKMFLNVIVSIGRAIVIFHSHKPTWSMNMLCWINRYPGRQERKYNNKKYWKQTCIYTTIQYATFFRHTVRGQGREAVGLVSRRSIGGLKEPTHLSIRVG